MRCRLAEKDEIRGVGRGWMGQVGDVERMKGKWAKSVIDGWKEAVKEGQRDTPLACPCVFIKRQLFLGFLAFFPLTLVVLGW